MANAVFPFNNKGILEAGYQEDIVDNVLRTEFATGTSEERLISSRETFIISASYHLENKNEIDLIRTFFKDSIRQGVVPFEWVDLDGVKWLVKLIAPIKIERKVVKNDRNHAILIINIQLLERVYA